MNRSRPGRQRRFDGIAGVVAAAAGTLMAFIGQLAQGPSAQAQPDDPFADIAADIQTTIGVAQADFSAGATDFSNGDILDGLNLDLAAADNWLYGTNFDVTVGWIEALTGGYALGAFEISPFSELPQGIEAAIEGAQMLTSDGQAALALALSDFVAGNVPAGLENAVYGIEATSINATNEIILGFVDSLLPKF